MSFWGECGSGFCVRREDVGGGLLFSMAARYSPAGPAINSPTKAKAKHFTTVLLAGPRTCMSGWGEQGPSEMDFHPNQKECIGRHTRG